MKTIKLMTLIISPACAGAHATNQETSLGKRTRIAKELNLSNYSREDIIHFLFNQDFVSIAAKHPGLVGWNLLGTQIKDIDR